MLAFGHGVHMCLGKHVALMEARLALEEVMSRMPEYEIGELDPLLDSAMMAPDDWARISGKKGERIVYVRTVVGKADDEQRTVETVQTGQYL